MATVSSGIFGDANTFNLNEIPVDEIREEVNMFLIQDEEVLQAFQTIRDQVVFTNKRIIVVNVKGMTGKKISYLSYPYAKVVCFGVETAGFLDIDSELILGFQNGMCLQFDFKSKVNIREICATLSKYIL